MATLKPGSKAPPFSLTDQNDNNVSLSNFKGRKVLLYFYPKANTPGCTKQACSISASLKALKELGVEAIGISPDTPKKQKNFDTKHNLGFLLLSDTDNKTAKAYGACGQKSMFGKTFLGIIRSSFLIDEKGIVMQAWYKVKPDDTIPNAMDILK